MKQKLIKTSIRFIAYALIIALAVCVLKIASSGTDSEITDKKQKIEFLADDLPEGMQSAAENERYTLYANLKSAQIAIYDKSTGETVTSVPQGLDKREDLKNAGKMELSSLLNIKYADRDSNITAQNNVAGCVNKDSVKSKKISGGVRFDFYFSSEGFLVPLEIVLTEQGIVARVPLSDIKEESSAVKLTAISVLPNFGAGAANETGYAFVPDGSGAIIPYGFGGTDYSQRVYGGDAAVVPSSSAGDTGQTARMPVYGAANTKSAFIGIITSGEARAAINVNAADEKTPFTCVYTEFIYRETMLVDVSQQTFESTQANMFEPKHCGLEAFTVDYRVVDDKSYVGMANAYRAYLMDEKGLRVIENPASALQLRLIGGVMHEEDILGIPVQRVLPVTSYKDVSVLAEKLRALGVDSLSINYLYWYKDGTLDRLSVDNKTEARLGGSKEFEKMTKVLSKTGTSLHLNLNFTHFKRSQSGFSAKYDSAQTVQQEPLQIYRYLLSTYQKDESVAPVFLLSPNSVLKAVSRWTENIKKSPKYRYSLDGIGNTIYSDFGKNPMDRGVIQPIWQQALSKAQKAAGSLMFSDANAYAFSTAGVIQEVPVDSSGFIGQSKSVPFYTIALHGLVEMSTPSVNASGSPQKMLLKALESGIELTYTLGYRNTDKLNDTSAKQYSYIDEKKWSLTAADQYKILKNYLSLVSGQAVAEHVKLKENVYKTVFENGVGVIVNYNDTAVYAHGTEIEANGYYPLGWQ